MNSISSSFVASPPEEIVENIVFFVVAAVASLESFFSASFSPSAAESLGG
jgi:hypothetical protein